MNHSLKNKLIIIYFLTTYATVAINDVHPDFLPAGFIFGSLTNHIILICLFYFFILVASNKQLYHFTIILKLIIFMILFFFLFTIVQLFISLTMYSIGDSGGIIRIQVYGDVTYQLNWYEEQFWNFIYSLHYPVYIFIFIKPFVNHLDKSIIKINILKDKKI